MYWPATGSLMCWRKRKQFESERVIFASLKFFSFSRGAKLGEYCPTLAAQLVCVTPVGAWEWCETV
jgi:hypothetical protein